MLNAFTPNRSCLVGDQLTCAEAAGRLQPPIPLFDLPVKGCDLLLRYVRDPAGRPNGLIFLKDTRHSKKLIFGS
jgi:hypothetical protein